MEQFFLFQNTIEKTKKVKTKNKKQNISIQNEKK